MATYKPLFKFLVSMSGFLIIILTCGMTSANTLNIKESRKSVTPVDKLISMQNAVKSDSGKTAGQFFKNVKVLKNIPADRLLPTMHFIEAGVGMNCGNCHVRDREKGWQFDKDDKPEKRKARKMIEMMEAINKNSFKGHQEVTCFTCHRGQPDPQKVPAVQTLVSMQTSKEKEKSDDEVIKVPNRLNTAGEIINNYISRIGGKDNYKKITSLKYEGSIDNGGRNASIIILRKAPDFYSYSVKTDRGEMTRGYNGSTAWEKAMWGVRELKGDDLEELKLESEFYTPVEMDKIYSNLKLNDVSIIGSDTVYEVDGKASEYRDIKLYFSTKSGLLVRQVILNKTPLGNLPVETDYKDYRKVDGVMIPFELHIANYENVQDIKFDNVTANISIDNSAFDMPKK